MKTPLTLTLTAALLGLAAATVAAQVPEAPPPRKLVLYFSTTVGARWQYRGPDGGTVEQVVTKVEPKPDGTEVTVRRVMPDGTTIPQAKYEVSGRGILQVETAFHTDGRVDPFRLDPPVWRLKLPAAQHQWRFAEPQRPYRGREAFTAGKPARVKVPTGEFEAIAVEPVTYVIDDNLLSGTAQRVWYAPGVGPVKWSLPWWASFEGPPVGEVVLVSFTSGTPKP